jgi:hypothetical protein
MTEAIPAAARESAEQVVTELYRLHRLGSSARRSC